MLLGAIEESKLAVIVFSKNYATSSWCLEELVKIIDCKRTNGQIVVPIFYDIDPSHVRNQSGSYADAFAKHEQRFKGNMQKVQGWRASLTEAANLAGWDCLVHRIESQLVEQIAMDVFQKLRCLNLGDLEGQIATYKHIAKLQTKKMVNDGFNLRDWKQLLATQNQITQLNMEKYKRSKGGASWDIESSDEDQ